MYVGLVGATNVGKSTLFNRLIGQFRAIVTDIAGTTSDILLHETTVEGFGDITLADSPGLDTFENERKYITHIVEESDVLLFVIDNIAGMSTKEQAILDYIIKKNKKKQTILVINKMEGSMGVDEYALALADWYGLGLEEVIGISAKNGDNLDELIDKMQILLQQFAGSLERDLIVKPNTIPLAIVGKPNAGKSTLLNQLAGKEISKVSAIAGTTRDYIMTDVAFGSKHYTIYDTAGMRKKASMEGIEKIAYVKTIAMIKYVKPVVLFLLDATEGLTHRDQTILQEIEQLGIPLVVGLNKSDLFSKTEIAQLEKQLVIGLPFLKYVPMLSLSAQEGTGFKDLFASVGKVHAEYSKRVATSALNSLVRTAFIQNPPRFPKSKICKIYYISQVEDTPPGFAVKVNNKEYVNFAFVKRLENVIRKQYGFIGTPIRIRFDEGEDTRTNAPAKHS